MENEKQEEENKDNGKGITTTMHSSTAMQQRCTGCQGICFFPLNEEGEGEGGRGGGGEGGRGGGGGGGRGGGYHNYNAVLRIHVGQSNCLFFPVKEKDKDEEEEEVEEEENNENEEDNTTTMQSSAAMQQSCTGGQSNFFFPVNNEEAKEEDDEEEKVKENKQ